MRSHLLISFLFAVLLSFSVKAQLITVKIDDFVSQHNGFEENDEGEINPINLKEINKRIRFFVEEKYP